MSRRIDVRRSLALTGAFVLATWGTAALPATALEPGNGNGGNNGNHGQPNNGGNGGGNGGGNSNPNHDNGGGNDHGNKGGNGGGSDKGNNGGGKGGGKGGTQGGGNDGSGGGKGGSGGGGKGGDPAGNNGTVKITPHGEMDGIPQNTPHVTCEFDIEWYGFDEGADIISNVTFAMQAPTSDVGLSGTDPSQVFVGGDPATGAGTETGFDGEQVYHLVFDGEPHPKQGYHVKLTINTPGSIGADVKHKVFWVQPCAEDVPAEETPAPAPGEETESPAPGEETESPAPAEDETDEVDSPSEEETETPGEDTEVLGEQASTGENGDSSTVAGAQANAGDDVPSAVDAGEGGNPVVDFVTSPLPLLVIALGAILGAFALVSRRKSA